VSNAEKRAGQEPERDLRVKEDTSIQLNQNGMRRCQVATPGVGGGIDSDHRQKFNKKGEKKI